MLQASKASIQTTILLTFQESPWLYVCDHPFVFVFPATFIASEKVVIY